jgi:hypothetical protein
VVGGRRSALVVREWRRVSGCEVVDAGAGANGGEILEGQNEEENSLIAYREVGFRFLRTRQSDYGQSTPS